MLNYQYILLIIGNIESEKNRKGDILKTNRLEVNKGLKDWRKNRRSVEDVPAWIGWKKLLYYFTMCPTEFHEGLFCVLFETGGRISEILELQPSQFIWNDKAIKVERMIVVKYRKKKRRDFLIIRDEQNLLANALISFVENCRTPYLFPKVQRLTGKIIPEEHTSRTRLYLKIREISDDLWCHWFRAQRASFNVHIRRMDVLSLQSWFEWKSADTPVRYVKQSLREMAEFMGIDEKDIPTRDKPLILKQPKIEEKIIPEKISKTAPSEPKKDTLDKLEALKKKYRR